LTSLLFFSPILFPRSAAVEPFVARTTPQKPCFTGTAEADLVGQYTSRGTTAGAEHSGLPQDNIIVPPGQQDPSTHGSLTAAPGAEYEPGAVGAGRFEFPAHVKPDMHAAQCVAPVATKVLGPPVDVAKSTWSAKVLEPRTLVQLEFAV
jgi:hypothetical protein